MQRYEENGLVSVPVEQVRPGDRLLVRPGEVVPVDGTAAGPAVLDESALTGEARPALRGPGEAVRSGATNASSRPLELQATAGAQESSYAAIVRLVAQAQASKAPLSRLADRYALLFLPIALLVAGIAWIASGSSERALSVLVIATPCPLILAAPIAIVAGISRAARRAIIIKDGGALETLARAKTIILDKTGTVTAGTPALVAIESCGEMNSDELLRLAASLDQASPHVLARALVKAARDRGLELSSPSDVEEEFGSGIRGRIEGHEVAVGRSAWVMHDADAPAWLGRLRKRARKEGASIVLVAIDGRLAGAVVLEDTIRGDARMVVRALRRQGFQSIILLTGDRASAAETVGSLLGVDRVLAECSPEEKVRAVKESAARAITVMVGDGVNDAPALAAAHVGVALGSTGATAASEAADVVILADRIDRLAEASRIARHSRAVAIQSIVAGMALSVAGMGFAAWGLLPPLAGAVAQELIDVLVVLNALRALGGRKASNAECVRNAGMAGRIRAEHQRLLFRLERMRDLAHSLDALPPRQARRELVSLHRFLKRRLLPHNETEESELYPAIARLIGGDDPTAAMSRGHTEITRLTSLLGAYVEDSDGQPLAGDDLRELRAVLYGLDAIVRLHFTQEEESYLARLAAEGPHDAVTT